MGLLDDYSRQAIGYDRTRGVSRSVIGPLRAALKAAPGRRLADIGGGTGNYAAALRHDGFEPLVIDRSASMLQRARAKGLATLEADAQRLPLADQSFDAAILISMLHHVDDLGRALQEAMRILTDGAVLAAMVFTREDAEAMWLLDLFPSSRPWMRVTHPARDSVLEALPRAKHTTLLLDDLQDASAAALSSRPDLMLDPAWRSQTSYFERMERDHPDELASGLRRLAADVAAGRASSEPGRASLFTWSKPLHRQSRPRR